MTKRRRTTPSSSQSLPFIAQLILVAILFLVAIGDGLRLVVSLCISFFPKVSRIAAKLIYTSFTSADCWIRKNIIASHTRRIPVSKPAKKQKSQRFRQKMKGMLCHLASARNRLFARRFCQFTLPKISLPRITIPQIAFPKFAIPKLSLPPIHIRLRPMEASISSRRNKKIAKKLHPFRRPAIHVKSFIAGIFITMLFIFIPYNGWLFIRALPNPQLLTQRDIPVSTKIFDRNGKILYEIYADQNRTPVALTEIPPYVKTATIAIEDRDFYHHWGFSIRGIIRAAKEITVNKKIQGGSTITQQLIKSALLTPDVNIIRKVKEIILAFWAEQLYTKDQILEMYLNQVPYGGTAWGIEAAAQTYFHKHVSELTLAEAALLAGLPAAPTEYSPFGSHPEKAVVRQQEVLKSMIGIGAITQEMMDNALHETLQFATPQIPIHAPHFVMYVKEVLEKQFGSRLVEHGGLRVTTSLDLDIQNKTQAIVQSHIDNLTAYRVGNGAALITDPKNGQILAMVGSKNYFDDANDGNVNLTLSRRQPGSSIKIVTYAAALELGMTAATLISDAPIVYRQAGSPPYAPVNYDGKFHGLVPLRYALANSYNIPAVKTLESIGIPAFMEKAKRMGIDSWSSDLSQYGLSLTLGSAEVTMLDMAEVYGTLANQGKRVDLNPILGVTDYEGNVLYRAESPAGVQAVSDTIAWILTNILSDNAARTQAFGPHSGLVIPEKTVAVKTGTTNDKRDNWADGYTPSYTVIVWVGNNDNTPMNQAIASGVTGATPIWHDIMAELLKNKLDEVSPKPDTIVSVPCYFGHIEYFVKGTEPVNGRCAPIPTPSITPTPAP